MLARDFKGDIKFPGLPLIWAHTAVMILTYRAISIVWMVLLARRPRARPSVRPSCQLDYKECNVSTSINIKPVVQYAWPV
jgi:hypothetical protein